VFAGGGVIRSGAESQLVQLAERLDAPILTSIQGRGVATWDHPLYVGPWSGEPAARQLVADSDICVVVGSKLSALSTSHWMVPFPTPTYRIDPGRPGHGKYPGVVDLRLDAHQALEELGKLVDPAERGAAERVCSLTASVRMELLERAPMEASFIAALDSALPAGSAVSFDMNKASFWFTKYLPCRPGVTQSFSSYLCMGSAIPNAIGMAERGPGLSVAVVGDGGLQMSVAELATLAERRTRVAVVVLVDGRYGLLRDTGLSEEVRGSRRLGIELWNPDFADLARTFGFAHRLCGTAEQLVAGLNECEGPTLIEVRQAFGRNW
jgi:acetolactate synthase-1/2/3 large subunit